MAYSNPNGQTAPAVNDIVLVTPMGTLTNESHFAQVTFVDPGGVTVTCRSTNPPNLCHVRSIANEVQSTTVTAAQLRLGSSSQFRNLP